jgi:hypothetical protein
MSSFGSVFELSWLSGRDGFQINGEAERDFAGRSVASAGDVNGDGYDDLIVGADRADPNGDVSGATYVVFGAARGFSASFDLSALDGTNGFRINGGSEDDGSGCSVASAGDVNGDGYDDLIIGADGAEPNGSGSGATYVVFGSGSAFYTTVELSDLDGSNGFKINGEVAGDYSGGSVASAGDVNGDGYDDLIIGAYEADPNGSDSGASYVVFGSGSGFSANIDLSDLDGSDGFKINGEAADDGAGVSVASAGDVNDDGYDDLIIGASDADTNGAAYVVFGAATGFTANVDLSDMDGTDGFQIVGEVAYDSFGFSVASAGDVNGDGYDDLIIGAMRADPNGDRTGASYVVFGTASAFDATFALSNLDGTNGFQINGEAAIDVSGRSVASAGDFNGDGFDDLIIGAYGADPNGYNSGACYVVFGAASGFAANLDLSDLNGTNGFQISGEATGDRVGISVASAGDVNGDGFDDLIIGASSADPNGDYSGASYVIFGKQTQATTGDDELTGASGAETLRGLAGNDTLLGMAGNDQLFGGADNDSLTGGAGEDTLIGGDGADVVSYAGSGAGVAVNLATSTASGGHAASDVISGFEGVIGSSFADTLTGGAAADSITGAAGADTINGGAGSDSLDGGTNNDTLAGAAGGDSLMGAAGNDTVDGGAGDDSLSGGNGSDTLLGGAGNDTITGGANRDILTGAQHNDVFKFTAMNEMALSEANTDLITDFKRGQDKIDLSTIDASTVLRTDDAFIFRGSKEIKENNAGEINFKKFDNKGTTNDYTLVYIDTDTDRAAEGVIKVMGLHNFTAGDFIL